MGMAPRFNRNGFLARAALVPLFCILILCTGLNCQAQKDYIITLHGDTLHGNIHFNRINGHHRQIRFTSQDGSKTTYGPGEIQGFHIAILDEDFISKKITFNAASKDLFQLYVNDIEDTLVTETDFIMELVRGNASLYFFSDSSNKSHYFMQLRNDTLSELNVFYHLQKRTGPGQHDEFSVQNAYKTQLLNAMGGCSGIERQINSSIFTKNSLIEIFDIFNSCKGGKSTFHHKTFEMISLHGGIFGGYGRSIISSTSVKNQKSPTQFFLFGICLEYRFKPLNRMFSLFGDFHYSKYMGAFQSQYYSQSIDREFDDFTLMVRANFPLDHNFQILVNAGPVFDFQTGNYSFIDPGHGNLFPSKREVEFAAGAGIRIFNHIILEARYSTGQVKAYLNPGRFQTSSSDLILTFQL